MTRKALPSKNVIRKQWAEWLVEVGKFDSVTEVMEADYCWACGFIHSDTDGDDWTEKAHILAHMEGGTENPDNLHLLCKWCHLSSEMLTGDEYFEWFKARNLSDMLKDFMDGNLESLSKSQRIKKANEKAKEEGKVLGRKSSCPPELLERIILDRKAGLSCEKIAIQLNAECEPTLGGGKQWYPSTVNKLLKSTDETFDKIIPKAEHGTKSCYTVYRCRCDLCRKAVRDYMKGYRASTRRPWKV